MTWQKSLIIKKPDEVVLDDDNPMLANVTTAPPRAAPEPKKPDNKVTPKQMGVSWNNTVEEKKFATNSKERFNETSSSSSSMLNSFKRHMFSPGAKLPVGKDQEVVMKELQENDPASKPGTKPR